MSRNVDKANSVLVRYQELEAEISGGYKDYSRYKRPTKIASVKKLDEALEWRKQVISDIKNDSTRIYDPSLNDFQLTELNDELNDLFKEKTRWDWHITQLPGGKNLARRKRDDIVSGKVIAGKRYFGRAVELPEVQELIKQQQAARDSNKIGKGIVDVGRIPKSTKNIYYGINCEQNNELKEFESQWTDLLREKYGSNLRSRLGVRKNILESDVTVPTIGDVEHWLVERRKKKLLDELNL
ncbi:hypothetical protein HG535_0E04610 [Zygotorulaspora mrakii]|uniref:Pre-mRNA-splicing factor ISY1 n=1 Tax=Zygotorulaspora mrakii TaxID=42260 RepID=A0A7H9B4A8_ZYGMR|nr:uncharacterized protein HG535_0E04610 [Zygotorulaspora mrakii]QLG73377.1 hypothetical protein HG535_0E04610 [Zygotorulaspora mrakii]